MTIKKTVHKIQGRLSLGTYLETLILMMITTSAIWAVINMILGEEFGFIVINYFLQIILILVFGLISFPVYVWAHRNRKITRLMIVEEQKEIIPNQSSEVVHQSTN